MLRAFFVTKCHFSYMVQNKYEEGEQNISNYCLDLYILQ